MVPYQLLNPVPCLFDGDAEANGDLSIDFALLNQVKEFCVARRPVYDAIMRHELMIARRLQRGSIRAWRLAWRLSKRGLSPVTPASPLAYRAGREEGPPFVRHGDPSFARPGGWDRA